jgi:hypothetical protein
MGQEKFCLNSSWLPTPQKSSFDRLKMIFASIENGKLFLNESLASARDSLAHGHLHAAVNRAYESNYPALLLDKLQEMNTIDN